MIGYQTESKKDLRSCECPTCGLIITGSASRFAAANLYGHMLVEHDVMLPWDECVDLVSRPALVPAGAKGQ